MKKIFSVLFLGASLCFAGAGASQAHSHSSAYLSGSTMMTVHNQSDYPIISIQSSNSEYGATYRWGSPLAFAGGEIFPHSSAVVNFGDLTGAWVFFVRITTANGLTHVYGNVNVCKRNNITVSDWR